MNKSKRFISLFAFITIGVSLFATHNSKAKEEPEFAKPGMVAYAASYSGKTSAEPQFSTQNSKTFQYLNLGDTHDYYRGDSVKVGIIDSGINYDHEDFMVNSATKVKGDSKYYSYQSSSSSWVYYKASQHGYSYIDDTLGHGTNVAATVAAAVNSVGGVGLAPNVELYVYKVTNSSNGYEFGAIQNALMDAKTLGLDVINMSFQSYEHAVSYNGSSMAASTGCSTIMSYYLNQAHNAGITLVGAAGNYNTDEPSYPGSNNYVINVGSLDATGTGKAGFSNYGSTIDLVAPGYVYVADEASNSAYTNTQGTSFSAPLVTAAIALYIQQNPSATPSEIETALYASCDTISGGSSWAGHGALNVEKFLGLEDGPENFLDTISVSPSSLSLEVADTEQLTVTGTFLDGNSRSLSFDDYEVMGSSNDEDVCTISESGLVTAIGPGSTTIDLISDQRSLELSVPVTVTASGAVGVTGVSLDKNALSIKQGDTGSLTATVSPSSATNKNVTWSSSNTSVATVSNGTVTAVAPGNATITVTTQDGGYTATCSVTVTKKLSSISVSGQTTAFTVGDSFSFGGSVTANYSDSTSANVTSLATFSGYNMSTAGNQTVTVSYTEDDVTKTTTYQISVGSSGGSEDITDYTVGTTKLASADIVNGMKVVWGTTSSNCARSIDSNWVYLTSTASQWLVFTIEGTSSGFKLKNDGNYVYSSAEKKVAFDSTNYTTFTLDGSGSVTNSSIGTYVLNSTGLRPYNSVGSYTRAYLYPLTLNKTVSSISISGYTTSFTEGDTFSFGGTVTANYDDNSHGDVTSEATYSGYDMTSVGNQTVTVTYKGKTQQYGITVSAGTLSSIAVSGQTLTYVKNAAFSFDGVCTATFENGYQKEVTPTSVSSPDMSTTGSKTITVSYTYNGKTKTTEYTISVNSYRTVMEDSYSVRGTITWSSSTPTISGENLSTSTSGYTIYENNSLRLGSGSNTGTLTVTSTSANIYKVVVSAKSYGSDSNVNLSIGGTSNKITSSYASYTKEYSTAVSSVALATTTGGKRANIQSVTLYTKTPQDIGQSEDCVGLETFITNYMHMEYGNDKGWCNDTEHNYYGKNTETGAKAGFNALNEHQRILFTTNSAYATEWFRLSEWARINGDALDSNNYLSTKTSGLNHSILNSTYTSAFVVIGVVVLTSIGLYFLLKKRHEKENS